MELGTRNMLGEGGTADGIENKAAATPPPGAQCLVLSAVPRAWCLGPGALCVVRCADFVVPSACVVQRASWVVRCVERERAPGEAHKAPSARLRRTKHPAPSAALSTLH